jgi:hypothetical protein
VLTFPALRSVRPRFVIGNANHFQNERGFAVTRTDTVAFFEVCFSARLCDQPLPRIEAIVRHELGHVIDYALPGIQLPGLPLTRERRADALAEHVWRTHIYYDEEDVQTLEAGASPRPERLGL